MRFFPRDWTRLSDPAEFLSGRESVSAPGVRVESRLIRPNGADGTEKRGILG